METRDNIILENGPNGPRRYVVDEDYFESVTNVYQSLFEEFDEDSIIDTMLLRSHLWTEEHKYYGMTKDEIKKLWKDNREDSLEKGIKLHKQIEDYYNKTLDIIPDTTEFSYFLNFEEDICDIMDPYKTEYMIYDKEYKVAGTVDMIFSLRGTDKYVIYDWKRTKKNICHEPHYGKTAIPEFVSHLEDTPYVRYSLQLNMYKYILEKNYNISIDGVYIAVFYPENENYRKIEALDLQTEVEDIFNSL